MAANITTLLNNEAAWPNSTTIEAPQAIPEALIFRLATRGGTVGGDSQTARIAYVDDDADAAFIKEGEAITADAPTISELVVPTKKIAVLTVASRESYAAEGVPNMLGGSLARSVTAKADAALLADPAPAGSAIGMTGLANYEGITDGGGIADSLDPIIDAIAAISGNGANPSAIVMGYDSWAYMLKLKDGSKHAYIGADVANSATPQLYGLPVILSPHAAKKTVLIIDGTQVVSAVGQVTTATSTERYFESDSIGIRVTFRFGYGVLRPDRLAKLTVGAGE